MAKRRYSFGALLRQASVLALCLGLCFVPAAHGDIVVDDFDELAIGDTFPLFSNDPIPGVTSGLGLSGALGQYRQIILSRSFPTLPSAEVILNSSVTADLNTGLSQLTATPSEETALYFIMLWFDFITDPDEFNPINLDLTGQTGLRFDYSSASDVELEIDLGNGIDDGVGGITQTGNSEGTFLMPGGSGSFIAPLSLINVVSGPAPAADFSSIDVVIIQFRTTTVGQPFTIDRIAFVPEPTSASALLGIGVLLLRRRRQQSR